LCGRRPPKEEKPGSEKGSQEGSQKSSQKILEQITRQPEITIDELAAHLGISPRAIKKHLRNLKEKGRLKRIGPDRGGRWEVIS
jgi:ATP-dependent DNA helicase RecG